MNTSAATQRNLDLIQNVIQIIQASAFESKPGQLEPFEPKPGQIVEVRILTADKSRTISRYFDDLEQLATEIAYWHEQPGIDRIVFGHTQSPVDSKRQRLVVMGRLREDCLPQAAEGGSE